jgi:hypothetical protein
MISGNIVLCDTTLNFVCQGDEQKCTLTVGCNATGKQKTLSIGRDSALQFIVQAIMGDDVSWNNNPSHIKKMERIASAFTDNDKNPELRAIP